MAKEEIYECEVKTWHNDSVSGKRVYGWELMPVLKAMKRNDVKNRCPECHGPVRLHKASSDGKMAAHAEHYQRNEGCSLGYCYKGIKKMHPHTIE